MIADGTPNAAGTSAAARSWLHQFGAERLRRYCTAAVAPGPSRASRGDVRSRPGPMRPFPWSDPVALGDRAGPIAIRPKTASPTARLGSEYQDHERYAIENQAARARPAAFPQVSRVPQNPAARPPEPCAQVRILLGAQVRGHIHNSYSLDSSKFARHGTEHLYSALSCMLMSKLARWTSPRPGFGSTVRDRYAREIASRELPTRRPAQASAKHHPRPAHLRSRTQIHDGGAGEQIAPTRCARQARGATALDHADYSFWCAVMVSAMVAGMSNARAWLGC
jgi:hypothetical protein